MRVRRLDHALRRDAKCTSRATNTHVRSTGDTTSDRARRGRNASPIVPCARERCAGEHRSVASVRVAVRDAKSFSSAARGLIVESSEVTSRSARTARETMKPARNQMLKLLDRSLIGLLIFIVMLLLGIQAVHAG